MHNNTRRTTSPLFAFTIIPAYKILFHRQLADIQPLLLSSLQRLLLISFKSVRHSTMFLLSVQTSKELEPQCDDQITLDYLSFHKSLFPQAWEKLSCNVCTAGDWGASPGWFHWTMKPFLPGFPYGNNEMIQETEREATHFLTIILKLPRLRNF